MRVIDLMRHTSGLTYGFQNRTNVDAAYRSLRLDAFEPRASRRWCEGLARVPLEFSPGTSWNYGVSTDVVGHLVSLASGLPFDEFVRTRILVPLGMHDTDFHVPEAKVARFADCYVRSAAGTLATGAARQLPRAAARAVGRRRPRRHRRRLPALLRDAAPRRRARRRAPRRPEDARPDAHEPPAGGGAIADFAPPGMFSEAAYHGLGFGLGFAVVTDPAALRRHGIAGRVLVGRHGVDRVLGRPGRGRVRRLHDAADAVEHVSGAARAQDDGERAIVDAGVRVRCLSAGTEQ
jgi:CubicO group peptidase (beta-lactamase class C family)